VPRPSLYALIHQSARKPSPRRLSGTGFAGSERRDAIEELKNRIEANADAYKRQVEESSGPRIEKLQRELEEVQRRYGERYGEEVSFSEPCPEPSVVFASVEGEPSGSTGKRMVG